MAEIKITKDNFESEVLQSEIPVLLDFYADWCGPCRMLAPVVAEIAEEKEGEIRVGKVNVDENPELSSAFGVVSIPMIAVLKNGEVTASAVGFRDKEAVLALLD